MCACGDVRRAGDGAIRQLLQGVSSSPDPLHLFLQQHCGRLRSCRLDFLEQWRFAFEPYHLIVVQVRPRLRCCCTCATASMLHS